jgi:hypothetical protein
MLPLIPLAISLAPEIGKWLFGDAGEKTATAVVAAVQAVTGTTDEAVASHVLSANPTAAADLRVKLAQIAADREKVQSDAAAAEFAAQLRDIADARAQTVALAQNHSPVQWAAPIVSITVLGTFGAVMYLALTRSLPVGSETLLNMLLGSLAAMATSVVGYWVGSSVGSAQKTELLYRSTPPAGSGAK